MCVHMRICDIFVVCHYKFLNTFYTNLTVSLSLSYRGGNRLIVINILSKLTKEVNNRVETETHVG